MHSAATSDFQVLLQATPSRCARIRVLLWLLPLVPLVMGSVLWISDVPDLTANADGDGLPVALLVLYGAVLLSALPAIAAWWLVGRYVTELAVSPMSQHIRVSLLQPWGTHTLEAPASQFSAAGLVARPTPGTTAFTPTMGLFSPRGQRLLVDLQSHMPWGADLLLRVAQRPAEAPQLVRKQLARVQRHPEP